MYVLFLCMKPRNVIYIICLCLLTICSYNVSAQTPFEGNVDNYVKRIPRSLEFMYNSLCDGASYRDEIILFAEAFQETYVFGSSAVFIPDFMDYSSKTAQYSLDNYLLTFADKYKNYIDNGTPLEFNISNMQAQEAFWTDDKNGVIVNVIYDNVLMADGKELYKGKSQAVIVFPEQSNPTEFRIQQLSSYQGGTVSTHTRVATRKTVSRPSDRSTVVSNGAGSSSSNASFLFRKAEQADRSLQYEKAVELYSQAIQSSSVDAMVKMGMNYEYGYGSVLDKDFKQAVSLYAKAAKLGSVEGCYRLAMCLRRGQGVPKDIAKARELLQRAADNGHKKAAIELRRL